MLKKLILSLSLFLAVAGANAQHAPGSWKVIPMSGTTFDYLQDTPSKVFYLTGGSLYSYDKEDNETTYYSPGTKISDSSIRFIRYNGDKKYVLLAYNNGNIDLIYDSGKVVNLPEIKDANLTVTKTINNVQFGKDRIYVATSFGIVVFDDVNHHVIESGIYNKNINDVFELGDNVFLFQGSDLMYSPKRERHNTLDKFTKLATADNRYVTPVSDTEYLVLVKSGNNEDLYKVTPDIAAKKVDKKKIVTVPAGKGIQPYKNGYYVAGSDGFYVTDGTEYTKTAYNSTIGTQTLSFWETPAKFWAANADGVGSYSLGDNGSLTVITDKYIPASSRQTDTWFRVNTPDGKGVLFSECGRSYFFPSVGDGGTSHLMYHEIYNWESGEVTPFFPYDNNGFISGGSSRVLFDQEDPDYIYAGSTANNGLSVFHKEPSDKYKNGAVKNVVNYTSANAPIFTLSYLNQVHELAYDRQGNLWTVMWALASAPSASVIKSPVKIIPKEYLQYARTDPAKMSEKDASGNFKYWLQPVWAAGNIGCMDAKLIFSSVTDKGLYSNGGWPTGVAVGIDNKGTTSIDDDIYQIYHSFRDQDLNLTSPGVKSWFEEDKNGWIWIGTDVGVFYVKDLDQIGDNSSNYLDVIRPKVARNDGTNYADYLLNSDRVINIAVDANNRKWIATSTSGLYCVSEDGTEILQQFNMDNSPLVSNVVTMVACQPDGNDVLIGTPEGLYVYSSDSAPAKSDYSEVYAYPNPVRPDYTGWITINGLMDNSLVKIADSQGKTVWQGKSSGGMAVWDGCDTNGNRVRSGVYMVMASQNQDGNSGAVTKIVVIN